MRCRQGKEESIPPTPSKPMLRKRLWSPEEDNKLTNYIMKNGLLRCWNYVANEADIQRSGKSCRLRWINHLRPDLNRGAFSYKEELLIIHLHSFLGNRWSLIAAQLPGRTDNDVKNYWNTCIKKRLKLKHHLSSSTNTKSITPSQYPNTKSVPAHEPHDAFTTGQNQFCVPDQLELSHGQVQDQSDHEFSIDPNPTHIQQLSYSQPWINASSVHPHKSFASHPAFTAPSLQASKTAKSSTCDQLIIEPCRRTTVLPDEAPHSAYYSPGSTGITIPALLESEWLKEKDENDENHMMNDYSNAWSAGHSYSNAAEYSHVVDPGAYTARDTGISIMDDSDSLYNGTLMGFISQVDSQSFT